MKITKRICTGLISALCAISTAAAGLGGSMLNASAAGRKYVEAKAPTCTELGWRDYWYDPDDGKCYTSQYGGTVLRTGGNDSESEQIYERALGHDFVPTWHWDITEEEHNGYSFNGVTLTLSCSRCDETVELSEYDYWSNRTDNSIRVTQVFDAPYAHHIGWSGYEATATYTYGSRTLTFTDRFGHDLINGIHYESEHYKNGEDFENNYNLGEHYDSSYDSHYYNYSYDLQARVAYEENNPIDGSYSLTENDTLYHIWDVTINADTLYWDLTRNIEEKMYKTLTWDPESHTYTVGTGGLQEEIESYSVDGEATRTVSITNDSNFAITRAVTVGNNKFTVSESDAAIVIGGSAASNITIDPTKFSNFTDAYYTSVGTATITLTASGSIQQHTSS